MSIENDNFKVIWFQSKKSFVNPGIEQKAILRGLKFWIRAYA